MDDMAKTMKFTITPEMERKSRQAAVARVERELMRDGVRLRAATFTDRRKERSRKACRGRFSAGE